MPFVQNQIGEPQRSYGKIAMSTSAFSGPTFAFTTSFQELTGLATAFTLSGTQSNFSMTTDGRLKYTGQTTDAFSLSCGISINNAGSFGIHLYKNGVALVGAECYNLFDGSFLSVEDFSTTLSTNDYISLWARRSANASPAVTNIQISAVSL